jgi:hypothetical protein
MYLRFSKALALVTALTGTAAAYETNRVLTQSGPRGQRHRADSAGVALSS